MGKRTSFFFIALLIGLLLAAAGFSVLEKRKMDAAAGGNDNTATRSIVLKAAHNLDQSHPVHLAMEYMKKRLEGYSGGTMSLGIYPAGQIDPQTQCIEQLQNGTLDLTVVSASPVEGFVPEMGVFSLPYVFRDREHYWSVLVRQSDERCF